MVCRLCFWSPGIGSPCIRRSVAEQRKRRDTLFWSMITITGVLLLAPSSLPHRPSILVTSFLIPTPIPYRSRRNHESHLTGSLQSSNRKWIPLASGISDANVQGFVDAQDLDALQELFSQYCDKEGLMNKSAIIQIPAIAEVLRDGDLLEEEFSNIWNKAPKFPDVETSEGRIDVDSFVQVYRYIDDLFEDSDEEYETKQTRDIGIDETLSLTNLSDSAEAGSDEIDAASLEAELDSIYSSICDENGLISKAQLKAWDEIQTLLDDGMLGEDEFDELWEKAEKKLGSVDKLDVDGFLSFNAALDDLFDVQDNGADDDDSLEETTTIAAENMSPSALFAELRKANGLVGWKELSRWAELNEMLADGDLLESELDNLFKRCAGPSGSLDEAGFVSLYQSIDDLFEADEKPIGDIKPRVPLTQTPRNQSLIHESPSAKERLLEAIALVSGGENALPCGLDSTEREQLVILNLVNALENDVSNIIGQRGGVVESSDLAGTWELLYSSSSAMKFNKGLSGLGGSFPNGRFYGLKQTLLSSKYLSDVEYLERIEVRPTSASFDVKVTGAWQLQKIVSLFTGQPTIVLQVEPDRVVYGPTSTKADHWKSLGCMNRLDLVYLDTNLRVMRGNTSLDTIFVWRRTG